ncbi:unnamed protein product [Anisakis simplex]|uniref:DUF3800 domain-containing protein n=1 Tax=Anisakis simplex TaxID=6269 RepID=A0A0M3J5S3_ANISI|nr:unnamed protein product [Anisakis simplex]
MYSENNERQVYIARSLNERWFHKKGFADDEQTALLNHYQENANCHCQERQFQRVWVATDLILLTEAWSQLSPSQQKLAGRQLKTSLRGHVKIQPSFGVDTINISSFVCLDAVKRRQRYTIAKKRYSELLEKAKVSLKADDISLIKILEKLSAVLAEYPDQKDNRLKNACWQSLKDAQRGWNFADGYVLLHIPIIW